MDKCSPIRIAFFDDRIEIESPGLLMPGMTVADMKSGVSMIRNPVIARVFSELRLVEQWGSGVKRPSASPPLLNSWATKAYPVNSTSRSADCSSTALPLMAKRISRIKHEHREHQAVRP